VIASSSAPSASPASLSAPSAWQLLPQSDLELEEDLSADRHLSDTAHIYTFSLSHTHWHMNTRIWTYIYDDVLGVALGPEEAE
jgi:hypothetical protein